MTASFGSVELLVLASQDALNPLSNAEHPTRSFVTFGALTSPAMTRRAWPTRNDVERATTSLGFRRFAARARRAPQTSAPGVARRIDRRWAWTVKMAPVARGSTTKSTPWERKEAIFRVPVDAARKTSPSKEAARMLGELREVDRSTARMRLASNVIGVADEEEEEDDWAKSDDEGEDSILRGDSGGETELKGTAAMAAAEARRARYVEIKESALAETLKASSRVVLHVVLEGAEQSRRVDEVSRRLGAGVSKDEIRENPSESR